MLLKMKNIAETTSGTKDQANEKYWLTIGFENVAETIVKKESDGKNKVVVSGPVYNHVDAVNKKLMENEGTV